VDRRAWLAEVMRRKLERFDVLYAPVYDGGWGRIGKSHAAYVDRVVQSVQPDGVILDAACGTGRFFSMILGSGRDVVGADWSEGMLEQAKFPDVVTERRQLQSLGFAHGFDAVICVDALENLPPEDWPIAMNALRRAAKPSAPVYITVELADDDNDLRAAYDAARAKSWPIVPGELAEDDGYHHYPERSAVRGWLAETGLAVIEQTDGDGYWHLLCRANPLETARPARRTRSGHVPWHAVGGAAGCGRRFGWAGKSTFARDLGRRTGIRVIHLDCYYWKPGWVETPADEWCAVQAELTAAESWIIDGNYGGTFDVRFSRADTVIVLALSRQHCLSRVLWRALRYRGRAVQADACPERFDLTFFRWVWRYPVDSRPRLDAALERHTDTVRLIELTSPKQVRAFLRAHR